MDQAGWKYLIMCNIRIVFKILTIYFFYPETQGRTREELSFSNLNLYLADPRKPGLTSGDTVFGDEVDLANQATKTVVKAIHHDTGDPPLGRRD